MQESLGMIPARKVNLIYPSAKSSDRFNPWPIIVQTELTRQGNQWIWKDGKGGFKEFLASLDEPQHTEVLEQGTIIRCLYSLLLRVLVNLGTTPT